MTTDVSPLFLGLDCSTQALKAVLTTSSLRVIGEYRVDFSKDLPQYGTKSGVLVDEKDGSIVAPVKMYVEAMDKVLDGLKQQNVDFSRIKAISGAAAQHSIILLTSEFTKTISASTLDPKRPLHEQFDIEKVLSTPFATNWQDSTTGQQCREMEQDVHVAHGQDGESPAMTMAKITGSSAHERFSGPQAKKIFQKSDSTWQRTEHVCLLSSFLTTILCADGKVRGPDEADASGMNLWDLSETSGRRWNEALVKSVVGGDGTEAKRLQRMLGEVEQDPRVSAGTVGNWFKQRYGFPEDCQVAYLTGDNPATLLSFALEAGDAIVSLGTSDTVLLATEFYQPHPNYHVFPHPAGESNDGTKRYMGMLCYKNGSLAREYVRDQLPGATPSWDTFNEAVTSESIPQPDQPESDYTFGFYYPKQEIIPRGVHGFYHVKQDQQGHLTLAEASDVKQADKTIHWSAADARRILESQFLSFKSRIQQLLPEESRQRGLERIYVAGGASANPVIVQLLSTILNGPVYTTSDGTTQGCAVGGAYRAAWAWHCLQAQTNGSKALGFGDFINEMTGHQKGGVSLAEGKVLAKPDAEQAKRYDELLPSWQKAEQLVIDHCRTNS